MNAVKWIKNTRFGRAVTRLTRECRGAVAMEYIVIALLIGAAVVALVMVFGGNLRNMFSKSNDVMTSTKVSEVKDVGQQYRDEQKNMAKENKTAVEAGDKLGGDFTDDHAKGQSGSK